MLMVLLAYSALITGVSSAGSVLACCHRKLIAIHSHSKIRVTTWQGYQTRTVNAFRRFQSKPQK